MPGLSVDQTELSNWISAQPLIVSEDDFRAMSESHLIDQELGEALDRDAIEEFVEGRQAKMVEELGAFLQRACEWTFENTPPLASFDLDAEQDDDE